MIRSLGGTTVVHLTFKPNGLDEPAPEWRIACMPDVTDFRMSPNFPNYLRSNDTRAVTCSLCKATPVFKEVQGREVP